MRPEPSDTWLGSCATGRTGCGPAAAGRTADTRPPTAWCAGASLEAEAEADVAVDAAWVDAAPDRAAGTPTWNGAAEVTDVSGPAGTALSAAAGTAPGGLELSIATPACRATCWTGATAAWAALAGDVGGELIAGGAVGVVTGAVGVAGAGDGATADEGAGGDGGRAATGAGVATGAGSGSCVADGAGAARGGRSPSGSRYPSSSDARRIPRWTLGTSCSGVPLAPIVPTVAPSPTVSPFAISIVPRWTSVTA